MLSPIQDIMKQCDEQISLPNLRVHQKVSQIKRQIDLSHDTAEEILRQMTRPSNYEVPPVKYAAIRQEVVKESQRRGDPVLTEESRLRASHVNQFTKE